MYECLKDKHYVGEEGTVFHIDCGQDVSAASESIVIIERPDGTLIEKQATPVDYQGSLNFIDITIAAGDFNQAGDYKCQPWLQIGTWKGPGAPFEILVEEPLSSSSSSSSSQSSSSKSSSSSSI